MRSTHDHGEGHLRGHTHGVVDPSILTSSRGIWAVKWSLVGLAITAAVQIIVGVLTGGVALLADTIHNAVDSRLSVEEGHAIAVELRHQLLPTSSSAGPSK